MKFILLLTSFIGFTCTVAFASQQCSFKALNGANSGTCSSDEFTVALWNSDLQTVDQNLKANPNLLYSCNFSPSYVYNGSVPEIMNPLIFSICHSKNRNKLSLIQMLLDQGADQDINCETPNLKITAEFCLSRVSDESLRTEIRNLLKSRGLN